MIDEQELRRRLELVRDYLASGKLQFAPHLLEDTKRSLDAVRYGDDGKIDLDTVDARVRGLAMAVQVADYRDQTKRIATLKDIQHSYFTYIERELGWLREEMLQRGSNPAAFASTASSHDEFVRDINPKIDGFLEFIEEFWTDVSEVVELHLQDMSSLKGVYGGDLFPSWANNIATTTGLYLDTIVLQCPFLHSRHLFAMWSPEERAKYLVKHALNLLSYKDLALFDVEPPIVVVLPFQSSTDEESRAFLVDLATPDALKHLARVLGRQFSSMDEADEFLRQFADPAALVKEVKDPGRLLFDTSWTGSLEQQFERNAKEQGSLYGRFSAGQVLGIQAMGRMMQATDVLIKSRRLGGTPLIEAETSWRYFQWKTEYSSEFSELEDRSLHVIRGLKSLAGGEMEWLGAIPQKALMEMRKQGAMEEIRHMLSQGVSEVAQSNPGNFFRTTDKVWDNIQDGFRKHQENVRQLRAKQLKFYGHDIGTWIVTGAIEVTAAVSGMPFFGVAALAAGQVTDAPKLKEIPGKMKAVNDEAAALKKSPLGLFFKHKR